MASCSPFKKFEKNSSRIKLNETNLKSLNGKYSLISVDSSYRFLDWTLFAKSPFGFENIPTSSDYVSFQVLNKKEIKVAVFENGNMIRSKSLKGKIKNDYFVFRKKRVLLFWLILNGVRIQKTRIAIHKNGDLILDNKSGGVLLLGIFPIFGSNDEHHNYLFEKIN